MIHEHLCLYQVGNLIGVYPDLMDSFIEFLVQCEKNGNEANLCFSLPTFIDFRKRQICNLLNLLAEGLLSGILTKSKSTYLLQGYMNLMLRYI